MDMATLYDDSSAVDPEYYQYVVPMGYLHRSIFSMDLRELYYIVELRTKPQGHISYRRIAYQMFEEANRVYPELMKWCKAVSPTSIGEHL
jgi:thymidylate synthase ThyX